MALDFKQTTEQSGDYNNQEITLRCYCRNVGVEMHMNDESHGGYDNPCLQVHGNPGKDVTFNVFSEGHSLWSSRSTIVHIKL